MRRSFANQAPNKESHLIHSTQELSGSALREQNRPFPDIGHKAEHKEKRRRCCQSIYGLPELIRHFSCLPEHGCRLVGLVMKQHAQRQLVRSRPARRDDDADAGPSLGNMVGQI